MQAMKSTLLMLIAAFVAACAGPPLPGQPVPGVPEVFPSPRPSAAIEPSAACPGESLSLTASRLPPGVAIGIWIKSLTAGGWKIGNPPHPREMGALELGSATTDAAGGLSWRFELTEAIAERYGSGPAYEIWLVYPEMNGETPIQPTAATFERCPQDPQPQVE